MINTQQIKSALPIAKLIEHYGGIKTAANQCWCIFHEKNGGGGPCAHAQGLLVSNL